MMEREQIADQMAEKVVGGSIVFNADCTMCGLNRNDQCAVNDLDAVIKFIETNKYTMREADMMRQMVKLGYITRVN